MQISNDMKNDKTSNPFVIKGFYCNRFDKSSMKVYLYG